MSRGGRLNDHCGKDTFTTRKYPVVTQWIRFQLERKFKSIRYSIATLRGTVAHFAALKAKINPWKLMRIKKSFYLSYLSKLENCYFDSLRSAFYTHLDVVGLITAGCFCISKYMDQIFSLDFLEKEVNLCYADKTLKIINWGILKLHALV